MFDELTLFYAIVGLGAIAVFTIIYLVLDPIVSGSKRVEKRKQIVAGGAKAKLESREGIVEMRRRKQVQEAVKDK
jgi:hypothetical protein